MLQWFCVCVCVCVCRKGHESGWCDAEELEWGSEGCDTRAAALAQDPIDWVVAADCVYIDNVRHTHKHTHTVDNVFLRAHACWPTPCKS